MSYHQAPMHRPPVQAHDQYQRPNQPTQASYGRSSPQDYNASGGQYDSSYGNGYGGQPEAQSSRQDQYGRQYGTANGTGNGNGNGNGNGTVYAQGQGRAQPQSSGRPQREDPGWAQGQNQTSGQYGDGQYSNGGPVSTSRPPSNGRSAERPPRVETRQGTLQPSRSQMSPELLNSDNPFPTFPTAQKKKLEGALAGLDITGESAWDPSYGKQPPSAARSRGSHKSQPSGSRSHIVSPISNIVSPIDVLQDQWNRDRLSNGGGQVSPAHSNDDWSQAAGGSRVDQRTPSPARGPANPARGATPTNSSINFSRPPDIGRISQQKDQSLHPAGASQTGNSTNPKQPAPWPIAASTPKPATPAISQPGSDGGNQLDAYGTVSGTPRQPATHVKQESIGAFFDSYYDASNDRPNSAAGRHQHQRSADMPNFEAQPMGVASSHQRGMTIDHHLNTTPAATHPPLPTNHAELGPPSPPSTRAAGNSFAAQAHRSKSQPDLRGASAKSHRSPGPEPGQAVFEMAGDMPNSPPVPLNRNNIESYQNVPGKYPTASPTEEDYSSPEVYIPPAASWSAPQPASAPHSPPEQNGYGDQPARFNSRQNTMPEQGNYGSPNLQATPTQSSPNPTGGYGSSPQYNGPQRSVSDTAYSRAPNAAGYGGGYPPNPEPYGSQPPPTSNNYGRPLPPGPSNYGVPRPATATGYRGPPPPSSNGYVDDFPPSANSYGGERPATANGYRGPPPPNADGYRGPPLSHMNGNRGPPPGPNGYRGPPPQQMPSQQMTVQRNQLPNFQSPGGRSPPNFSGPRGPPPQNFNGPRGPHPPSPNGQRGPPPPHSNGPRGPPPPNFARPGVRAPPNIDSALGAPHPSGAAPNQYASPESEQPKSPDALPHHPVPVRPGLMANSLVNQANQPLVPAPTRQYSQNSTYTNQESNILPPPRTVEEKRKSEPVTLAEIAQLQEAVRAHPGDLRTQLTLAKKYVEAAAILADEGGKADIKTRNRNRERYVFDSHKIVKKLAQQHYPDAMFYLADCHSTGRLGLSNDPKEAYHLYQAAAKAGHAQAAYRTAVCCEMGMEEGGGTKKDPLKSIQWYKRAAALGDTPAMYKMGMILLKGLLGQPRNQREAIQWLQRAAECADEENPHALHELAMLYENASPNDSILRDEAYSHALFTQAAELGYKFSQFRLGCAYEYGLLGCAIDPRASIAWYSRAAVQNEHQSELALSGWYLTGAEGVLQQSDTEAYLWARKAAQSGLAKAEYAMGYLTEVGIGVSSPSGGSGGNLEDAKRWYWKAAAQGFPKARERLEELRRGGAKAQKSRERVSRSKMGKGGKDEGECVVM